MKRKEGYPYATSKSGISIPQRKTIRDIGEKITEAREQENKVAEFKIS
jgi:hypothetical protein